MDVIVQKKMARSVKGAPLSESEHDLNHDIAYGIVDQFRIDFVNDDVNYQELDIPLCAFDNYVSGQILGVFDIVFKSLSEVFKFSFYVLEDDGLLIEGLNASDIKIGTDGDGKEKISLIVQFPVPLGDVKILVSYNSFCDVIETDTLIEVY